jgi:hypothetical protein
VTGRRRLLCCSGAAVSWPAAESYSHFCVGLTNMFLVLLGVLATVGCQTQQQMIQSQQAMAIQTALNRARFDMDCSSATGTVLSTNVSQPAIQGRFASAYGVQRLVYTVGVRGCGQHRTYVVVCPQGGGGCFAAEGR